MTVFSYRAIDDDNKEVRGQVDAPDLDGAKHALEHLHLDVIEVYEATRMYSPPAEPSGPQPVLRTTFAFEGTDQTGTVRRGTMQAETKYQAFERLKHDQKLMLTMLSPLGVTPQHRDNDLENWQRKELAAMVPINAAKSASVPPVQFQRPPADVSTPTKTIGFTQPDTPKQTIQEKPVASALDRSYHPITATLRLYSGWLLAWYGLFVAIGDYANVGAMPWDIPFVQAFFVSPLIFSFIVAIFLFLLLGAVQKAMHGRMISGIALSVLGIAGLVGVRWSL